VVAEKGLLLQGGKEEMRVRGLGEAVFKGKKEKF